MPLVRAELALKLQASIAERAKANQGAAHGNEFKARRKGSPDVRRTYPHRQGDRQGGGGDIVSATRPSGRGETEGMAIIVIDSHEREKRR